MASATEELVFKLYLILTVCVVGVLLLGGQTLSFKTLLFKSNCQDFFPALLFLRICWVVKHFFFSFRENEDIDSIDHFMDL